MTQSVCGEFDMKVLHLLTTLDPGGIEKWIVSMSNAIPSKKCSMDVCCKGTHEGDMADEIRNAGGSVFVSPLTPLHIGFVRDLKKLVRSRNYDVVHNHLEAYSGLPVWICKSLNVPVITSFHNTVFPAQTWLRAPVLKQLRGYYSNRSIRYALQYSSLVTGCSRGVLEALEKDYGSIASPSKVLYYGVRSPALLSAQSKVELRESVGVKDGESVILHVGSFKRQKNHEGLLKIFKKVYASFPSVKMLLVGSGPLEHKIRMSIDKLGLSGRVLLLGRRTDVFDLMQVSNLMLLPSHFEGFGRVAIEAGATGLPLVASDVSGLNEAAENGRGAILHASYDVEGMSESVLSLLRDASAAVQIGQAGLQRVEERFSLDIATDSLYDTYSSVLSL